MRTRKLVSEIKEEGRLDGEKRGLQPFLLVLAKRVGRSLTEQEAHHVELHLTSLGGDALFDAVDALDDAALETWLQTPPQA